MDDPRLITLKTLSCRSETEHLFISYYCLLLDDHDFTVSEEATVFLRAAKQIMDDHVTASRE